MSVNFKTNVSNVPKGKSSSNFGILMKRPSSLPDAPNFVEHLDSLLDSGIVTGIVDDGKPKMWK